MKITFVFRDLFKAPRIALSFQRIWIVLCGLIPGYFIYAIFSYLALSVKGLSFAQIWTDYHLIPYLDTYKTGWLSWIIYIVGILLFIMVLLITAAAVSRAAYMFLKGQNFYTWREAYRFAFGKTSSLILAPIALLFIIACFFIAGWFIGLLGNIPWAGSVGISLFSVIWILASLLLVFLIIILVALLMLMPAILATTDEDAFESIFQTISLIWHQPFRWLGYEAGCGIISVLGLSISAFFVKRAILLFFSILQVPFFVTGQVRKDFSNIMYQSFALLQGWLINLTLFVDKILGELSSGFKSLTYLNEYFPLLKKSMLPVDVQISSYIITFSLLFIAAAVFSYAIATFNVGNTIIYLTLRYKKEQENLLEREDKEEIELEHTEPDLPGPSDEFSEENGN